MEQGDTRVIYKTRPVDVPGYGGHIVLEIVEVPYDQRSSALSGGAMQRDAKQEDKEQGVQSRRAEIGDLF